MISRNVVIGIAATILAATEMAVVWWFVRIGMPFEWAALAIVLLVLNFSRISLVFEE
jgi:hypothetical protein